MKAPNTNWKRRLKEAGWEPGDIYNPKNPIYPFRTKNLRLQLMNKGLWSERLVYLIIKRKKYKKIKYITVQTKGKL